MNVHDVSDLYPPEMLYAPKRSARHLSWQSLVVMWLLTPVAMACEVGFRMLPANVSSATPLQAFFAGLFVGLQLPTAAVAVAYGCWHLGKKLRRRKGGLST